MNNTKKLSLHYLALAGVIALGIALRFWHLGLKALWLDEVLTALFSLGHSYKDLPLEVVFPLSSLGEIFTLKPEASCAEIAHTLATQSTHPPLFFCLMHQWLNWVEPVAQPLAWKVRSLPALFGVGAIAAVYVLNRIAFSPTAGLIGAAIMAISPFGVYLSQEARHYTLPVLLITLALLGLIQILHTLYSGRQLPQPIVWLSWGVVNSLGCYVHYFFILAFIAQLLTLIGLMYWRRQQLPRGSWIAVSLAIVGVAISYLPWLPVVLGDYGSPETGWLPTPVNIAPVYQLLVGWLLMVIALPVEEQPLWIVVPVALLMLGFGGWVAWQAWKGLKYLWRQPSTQLASVTLSCFTLCVLLQFFAIIYLLGKDISVAPRYNFVYFPAICALLGASLASRGLQVSRLNVKCFNLRHGNPSGEQPSNLKIGNGEWGMGNGEWGRKIFIVCCARSAWRAVLKINAQTPRRPEGQTRGRSRQRDFHMSVVNASSWVSNFQPSILVLSLALLSCVFVISNLVFLKPFLPQQVAQNMNVEPALPTLVVMGYNNSQNVALGLSFALAITQLNQGDSERTAATSFVFLKPERSYESFWQKLSKLPALPMERLNLWVVAPGLRRQDYPPQVFVASKTNCLIDSAHYHRMGVPYQLYRCGE